MSCFYSVMLIGITAIQSVVIIYCYAEYPYSNTKCHVNMLCVVKVSCYAECHYSVIYEAKCHGYILLC